MTPLHPAVVHIPLGLAFVIPVLALGFAWALWTGRLGSRGWLVIVALQALLLGAGVLAMNTGAGEEDRVEAVVPHAAIEAHEEYAEQFLWAAGATLGLAALVLFLPRPSAARAMAVASIVGTVIVAGAAVRVGHAGGQLVYVHNAGAAYGQAAAASSGVGGQAGPPALDVQRADTRRDHDR